MRHHRLAHTTPEEAGQLAERAGVRLLGLRHVVPQGASPATWRRAAEHFHGELRALEDLDEIEVASSPPTRRA
jgi:ribonuclease BN (tRNA processing enzyme)